MSMPDMAALEAKVAGSSFYAAMKLMPAKKRAAMFAIYAFCRAVDDIADDLAGDRTERAAALESWRRDLAALYLGREPNQAAFLVEAVNAYGLKHEDFIAVIDGMAMDVAGDIVAPDRVTLDLYCDRVASAVGRLSVKVFGMSDEAGVDLSHHLGRALQLTNILRDVAEDADLGRLYLPMEFLSKAGIALTEPHAAAADARLPEVMAAVGALAESAFADATAALALCDKEAVRPAVIMMQVYRRHLDALRENAWRPVPPPRGLARLKDKAVKLWTAIHYGLF